MQAGESAQRLFFALWPDPAVRAALAGVTAGLKLPRGRLTPPQNLHVTLVFLGAADAARRACVEAAAGAIQAEGFAVTLDRTGWWRRPQVFWAGSSVTPPPLLDLVRALQAGCEACGFPRENRPFEVHATLARKVPAEPPALDLEPIPWPVDHFVLVESALTPAGSEYRVLRSWPLGGGNRRDAETQSRSDQKISVSPCLRG